MYSFHCFGDFFSIYLVASLNPKVDRFIDWAKKKFNLKALKSLTIATIIFFSF